MTNDYDLRDLEIAEHIPTPPCRRVRVHTSEDVETMRRGLERATLGVAAVWFLLGMLTGAAVMVAVWPK